MVRFQTKRNLRGEESLYDIKVFKKASGPSAANRASGDLKATTDGVSSGPDNFSLRQLGERVKRREDEVPAIARGGRLPCLAAAGKGRRPRGKYALYGRCRHLHQRSPREA